MMDLPRPLAVWAWKEIDDFSKERNMPFITGSDIALREEGLAEGLARAREYLMTGIEELLDLKFGPSGRTLLAEIRPIEDLDLLRKILHSVKQAGSPEALRGLWAKTLIFLAPLRGKNCTTCGLPQAPKSVMGQSNDAIL